MIYKTGVPTVDMIKSVFPSLERIKKGPVVVAECYQNIPCNPCQTSCKFNAIKIGEDINNRPQIDYDKCRGCGLCISKCPGLALMVIDGSIETNKIYMKIPYEFLPLPKVGNRVKGLNREGIYVTDVEIIDVSNYKYYDKTPIITISFDKKYLYDIRNIKV